MTETDEEFRLRLLYVAADGEKSTLRIHRAGGYALDSIGEEYGLKRLSGAHVRYYRGQ